MLRRIKLGYLPTDVMVVCISSMLIAISVGMTFSISPHFITQVLGFQMISLGILEGVSEGMSQLSKLLSGVGSDLSKRKKPILLFGFFLALLSKPFFIMAQGMGMLATSKVMERISNGIMGTPRDAYVAEATPFEKRGEALGLMMTLKTLGIVIGSFLIAFLLNFTDDYRLLLWVGVIPCLTAIVLLWLGLDEKNKNQASSTIDSTKKSDVKSSNKFLLKEVKNLPAAYWGILTVASLFMLARVSDSFIILRLSEVGAPHSISAAAVGIFNLVSAITCLPIGRLSDKYNRKHILYFSFFSLILAYVFLVAAGNMWMGLVGVLFWGAQRGTSQMLFIALISDSVSRRIIGTALGLFYFLISIAAMVAGTISGKLADSALEYTFMYGLVLSLVALMVLMIQTYFSSSASVTATPVSS